MNESNQENVAAGICVLRLASVIQRTGLSRTTLYNLMDSKSRYFDPTFPQRIRLTGRSGGAIGFLEHEINKWISAKSVPVGKYN
jgi:prophage regulatory protein